MKVEIQTMEYIRLSDCPNGSVVLGYMSECDTITFGNDTEAFIEMEYIVDFLQEEGYWESEDIHDFVTWVYDDFTSMDPDGKTRVRVLLA